MKAELERRASGPVTSYSKDFVATVRGRFAEADKERGSDKEILAGKAMAGSICETNYPLTSPQRAQRVKDCTAATRRLLDVAAPSYIGQPIVLPDALERILTDPVYDKALAKAALKMLAKTDKVFKQPWLFEKGGGSFGDLYQDLYDSFLEVDPDRERAERGAKDVLSVYGARGANYFATLQELTNRENVTTVVSLQAISASLNLLQEASLGTDKSYAYPPGFKTECSYGRPYHFWMPYVIADRLAKEGFSRDSIVAALHLANTGYAAVARFSGGEGDGRGQLATTRGRAYVRETQKNIAFNDVGAFAGAGGSAADLPSGWLDEQLLAMFNKSATSSSLTAETSQLMERLPFGATYVIENMFPNYLDWVNRVSPNSMLDYLITPK